MIRQANDTCMVSLLSLFSVLDAKMFILFFCYRVVYGLAAAVFTQNLNRAIETAHKLQAGTCWVSFFFFLVLSIFRT